MLSVHELHHRYQSPTGIARDVLNIPQWQVATGEQVLLRGVSGSGKTSLFNVLTGILRPTHGTVRYGEQSLYQLSEEQRDVFRARHLGYVFQNHHLIASLTALENVIMPMAYAGVPRRLWRVNAQQWLDKVQLADFARYRPHQLSTGQRLRVAIARALANTPQVLLADEPTASLDVDNAHITLDLLQNTCRELGAILIVASHDPALYTRFGRVVDLRNGELSEASV